MSQPTLTLVCFAVEPEAKDFRRRIPSRAAVRVLLTGMGPRNAQNAIRAALQHERPRSVLTCGFAGGLHPGLTTGSIVFSADPETGWEQLLVAAGAQPANLYCQSQVATTAAQKRLLRETTGADAVEMESGIIRGVCREQQVPSATLRAILDTADEDLPLDFNQLMTEDQRLDLRKLAWAIAKSPGKIRGLLQLQRQTRVAAEKLAAVLVRLLE